MVQFMEHYICPGNMKCVIQGVILPYSPYQWILAEMDGYTFQCYGINYQTNTVLEGTVTELNVTVLSGVFTGELFWACIHGYMFLIIISIFRKSSCHSRWFPGV